MEQAGGVIVSNEYKDWFCDVMTTLNAKMFEADFLPEGWTDTFVPKMKLQITPGTVAA